MRLFHTLHKRRFNTCVTIQTSTLINAGHWPGFEPRCVRCTQWHCDRFPSQYFRFPLSASFHRCCIFTHVSFGGWTKVPLAAAETQSRPILATVTNTYSTFRGEIRLIIRQFCCVYKSNRSLSINTYVLKYDYVKQEQKIPSKSESFKRKGGMLECTHCFVQLKQKALSLTFQLDGIDKAYLSRNCNTEHTSRHNDLKDIFRSISYKIWEVKFSLIN
jgi:hypothetical protein